MYDLDELDRAILIKLEADAKMTLLELSHQLGAPRSTIRERIQRLERNGVIRGYSAVIAPEQLGFGIKVIVQVTRDQRIPAEDFVSAISAVPEVTAVQLVTGEVDELVTLHVRSVEHLRDVLYNSIGSIPGVIRTSTVVVLSERTLPFTARFARRGQS